ncbi:MAG TPA: hypothetical protein VN700_02275 [Vicinamibacterales bacterium]|nr:hypothetical protein [Vicinamibacterales bacterium]
MTRLIGRLVIAVALVALPLAVRAEQGGAKPPAKTLNATGAVSAVTVDSLTVKGKTDTWTFTIDKTTVVTAKGATHKSLELKAEGKTGGKLTDFVKVGDNVTIGYHDLGATKHAATIRVTPPPK